MNEKFSNLVSDNLSEKNSKKKKIYFYCMHKFHIKLQLLI